MESSAKKVMLLWSHDRMGTTA